MSRKFTLFVLLLLAPVLLPAGRPYKNSSVLASGHWYRMAVVNSGIHRITFQDIEQMGINPAGINPANIRIYGNGGGMLPELNEAPRIDDLLENAIYVSDGGDGSFDAQDYILFYGEAPDKWYFDEVTKLFYHQKNLYSDSTYYFLVCDLGPGARIGIQPSTTAPANSYSRRFEDYAFYESDQRNLIKSGKIWYGEVFDNAKTFHNFSFHFPNIDTMSGIRLKTYAAARAPYSSRFAISANGVAVDTFQVDYTDIDSYTYAKMKIDQSLINNPKEQVDLRLDYIMPTDNSTGWLNYLELNCLRNLIWTGPQMSFRDVNSVSPTKITEFVMRDAMPGLTIWEITDKADIKSVEYTLADSLLKFRLPTDILREFIAFDGSQYHTVTFSGEVANQDLHAIDPAVLTIVTHPAFMAPAEELAAYHHSHNNIPVNVVTTEQVFTEFASGQPDITAIRDFMKMQYDNAGSTNRPKYLLLFGDGSYDPKNRIPNNNNLVPTFQSTESLKSVGSYVTDDYFGIMGDKEGQESNGTIDIGIGRFPVSDTTEAWAVVNKIIHYGENTREVMADWRNVITLVADDENENLHMIQAEELSRIVAEKYPSFNVSKIYFDAYKMTKIPAGMRFPDANTALNKAVEDGAVVLNYTGHGGEAGWSYEQVLTTADIEKWDNYNRLPVFVTATCEFSRFDNPERFSAGEMVILHPNGGAIALYSTTRLAMATSNFRLDTSFFRHLMDRDENGEIVKMGDLIRISKNNNSNNNNIRNFLLLGDPAQSISFPFHNIRTTAINNEALNQPDTALGLSTVTIKGIIEDELGQKLTGFNGTITPKVFDKPITYTTLGNTDDSYPQDFESQNSLLYTGNTTVAAGEFEYSFVMPRSIALQFGAGKLSHYATNGVTDAGGYSNKIIIGGSDPNINPENQGPEIGLWLDNRNFTSGMKTGKTPLLISDLMDTNGINYLGLGIGHDILAVIDNDRAHSILLNDYFAPHFGSYSRGTMAYILPEMAPGPHSLSLKAWDMFDNSSEKAISFYVTENQTLTVQNVMASPNPLITETWFIFQPMEMTGGLDIQIRIFDLAGKPVKTITASYPEYLTELPRIRWDGTGDYGQRLTNGVYPFEVTFKGKNGAYSKTSQKLVIMK